MLPTIPLNSSKSLFFVATFILSVDLNITVGAKLANDYSTEAPKKSGPGEPEARYLVFPTPRSSVPTKVQLVTGLGLPMEVDISMIVGYVMKFSYALPYNASYLTHPNALRYDRSIDRRNGSDNRREADDDKNEEVPKQNKPRSTSRWEIYRVIESALDGFQLSGKGCLLKTVCQLAEVPFEDNRAGLVAELIHVLLTPSSTREKYEVSGDQEYDSAEAAGKDNPGECENLFPECDQNLLEYFTETNVIEQVSYLYGISN